MTQRHYCEHHPSEPLQYCSQCVREVRLETRRECADLAQKMAQYRIQITGKDDPLQGWLDTRHTTGKEDADDA